MFKYQKSMPESKNNPLIEQEKEIQKFWADNKIFQKSLDATKKGEAFSFYDGPPFATGTPHYGHLVASIMKDVVPRYQTMKGKYVERRWGWDCHGLPIENIVENELGIKSKKDIEEKIGIVKFNELCRSKVLGYVEDWEKTMNRFGRWADMDHPYKTMDLDYMESVWWVFKQLWDKGLIYEGYHSMHICPRCETTLSQQEVSEGYKDIKDLSVTAKFELADELGTYILAWTTTPWTLPGNVALAVGENIDYVSAEILDSPPNKNFSKGEKYIFSRSFIDHFISGLAPSPIEEGFGVELYRDYEDSKGLKIRVVDIEINNFVGKKYKPLFPYYLDQDLENKKNLYSVVSADFVTTEDGTGVVHIAPAYGEDDMQLSKEKNLPIIQNVTMSGHFTDEVADFSNANVKPAGDTQATDVLVVKYLAEKNLLFAKEKYEHSYPHCWRCDTPLINYATSSWFVKVTNVKPRALILAKNISWVPEHIKDGRFGKWLEGARDWSISRQRFWASVMPVWKCQCGEIKVFGSIDDLKKERINRNDFYIVRHGESEKNIEAIFDTSKDKYHLTDRGVKDITKVAEKAKKANIDLIISSDILRARETAEIIGKKLGIEVIFDDRLNEVKAGDLEGQKDDTKESKQLLKKWAKGLFGFPNGENLAQVKQRTMDVIKDADINYNNRKILFVSHGDILRTLIGVTAGIKTNEIFGKFDMPKTATLEKLENGIFDLHKDVIDLVKISCHKCGHEMSRIPDVLDTWFDSGSMPYAQKHFPFENEKNFKESFPAEFIAEGADQTRAWFYYLHVIATAIFDSRAFENAIVNGIVLAEDGKKMSKRLQNYPEPDLMMDKYGADALRFYLLSSPVMSAENLNFSEVGVKEAFQKVVMLTNNVLKFYKLYENETISPKNNSKNILDKWLVSKLNELIGVVTKEMDNYQLSKAVRPIQDFVDEFSTWWLRRSRDRFKSGDAKDKQQALSTFNFVLIEMSKVMAPFVPFLAEYVYRESGGKLESVHLDKWPKAGKIDHKIIEQMSSVRKVVEMGLARRAEKGIKIRQPLSKLKVIGHDLPSELAELIAAEVNVKKVEFEKGTEIKVELDIELTEELKLEGFLRELIRTINSFRKDQGLTIGDKIKILWQSESREINKVLTDKKLSDELKNSTITEEFIKLDNNGIDYKINSEIIKFEVKKV